MPSPPKGNEETAGIDAPMASTREHVGKQRDLGTPMILAAVPVKTDVRRKQRA